MPGRVVIGEGDPDRLALFSHLLGDVYLEVADAGGNLSAIARAAAETADLVILGGSDDAIRCETACRLLSGSPATAHLPVMAIVEEARRSGAARLLDAGADDVLFLPGEAPALGARAINLVRAKLARDPLRIGPAPGMDLAPEPGGERPAAQVLLVGEGGFARTVRGSLRGRTGVRVARVGGTEDLASRLARGIDDLYAIALAEAPANALRLAGMLRAHPAARASPILLIDPAGTPFCAGAGPEAVALGIADATASLAHPCEIGARIRALLRRRARTEALRGSVSALVAEAGSDPLTGLANRRHAEARLAAMASAAAASGRPVAVLMIDLDGFKAVNDRLGHPAGDAALREAARRICSVTRSGDLVARMGGDEFLVAGFGLAPGAAADMAERIRHSLGQDMTGGTVTVSVGVAGLLPGETAEALVARADAALYRAKGAGRNRVALATGLTV